MKKLTHNLQVGVTDKMNIAIENVMKKRGFHKKTDAVRWLIQQGFYRISDMNKE